MVYNLYPDVVHENDLSPDDLGEEIDEICEEIHQACEGWGTDESGLISALGSRDAETRTKISMRFPELQDGKELKDLMKSECGKKNFGTALQFLAVPPHKMEVKMIQKACDGLGTNELMLYPIICGRSNEEMTILKREYFDETGDDLGRVLDAELGGDLEKLIFNCLQGCEEEFDEEYHNEELVEADVAAIHEAGQGSWGTDESGFFKIIIARPSEHLEAVNDLYADKHGYTLFKVMENEIGGIVGDACLFELGMKFRPYKTIAKLIKNACAGFGTNELLLTCCLIRYQPILRGVMDAHEELFIKSVEDRITDECGGDYEKLLLEVCAAAGCAESDE